MHRWVRDHWLRILAIVLALGAVVPVGLPFAYFQITNWVVVGAAVTTAHDAWKKKNELMMWIFIAVAVMFNPLAPLYLTPLIWQVADVVVAMLFGISFVLIHRHRAA